MSWRMGLRTISAMTVALCLTGCGGGESETEAMPDDRAAVDVVIDLFAALEEGTQSGLVGVGVTEQVLVVAMTEGISVDQAMDVLAGGSTQVEINYWEGFATSLRQFVGGDLSAFRVGDIREATALGRDFVQVPLVFAADGVERAVWLQETTDGWRVDLIATFPESFSAEIPDVLERLRDAEGAANLRAAIIDQRPSLVLVRDQFELEERTLDIVDAAIAAIGG